MYDTLTVHEYEGLENLSSNFPNFFLGNLFVFRLQFLQNRLQISFLSILHHNEEGSSFKEMSLEEIEGITGFDKNNIKVKMFRARKKLGEHLSNTLKTEVTTLL